MCGEAVGIEKAVGQSDCLGGGREEIRTLDLCNANAALSQLSHAPAYIGFVINHTAITVVGQEAVKHHGE